MYKRQCLRKQVIVMRHLYPVRFAAAVLFGFAPETKIWLQAPVSRWVCRSRLRPILPNRGGE
jgi:hypothetical protein